MGLLRRLLGGSGCGFWSRTGRARIGATRKWAAGRHDHVESCAECRARLQRERQYLEKLRGAAVPEASEDLTARLLARTGQLAAERAAAERTGKAAPEPAALETTATDPTAPEPRASEPTVEADSAGTAATEQAGTHRWPSGQFPAAGSLPVRAAAAGSAPGPTAAHRDSRRGGRRLPVLAVGGAVAALAFMSGTAYVMGGDDAVPVDSAGASALAHPDAAGLPADGAPLGAEELFDPGVPGVPGTEETGPRVAFGLGGEPDFTPAGTLSAGQLAAFRSQGWTCPELHALGFHLMWARAGVIAGDEVLELRLTDGQHFATVLEQHAAAGGPGAAPAAPASPGAEVSPINVLTGHAAVADGFTRAEEGTPSAAPKTGNGALWVNPAPPYRAIYQTSAATYTYVSDLPAEQADDGVAALTLVSSGAPVQGSRNGIPERIERGLSRILEHLAP